MVSGIPGVFRTGLNREGQSGKNTAPLPHNRIKQFFASIFPLHESVPSGNGRQPMRVIREELPGGTAIPPSKWDTLFSMREDGYAIWIKEQKNGISMGERGV
ncbi:hypothetical protein COV61_02195 [Candidatus Micrarchaeota archaeon CG11_big_fil_rev_8_21_14_0_20_47_5]|nr:MAG: hypothetical protein AUJ17_03080 [Candidatus Micrarchaeota archaeon CG1_02_47_40]PIN83753.1 MAG: hypothetical protein COV61_02195 [Candidatus Micrarchaeota archaeon CG11_big_fil_rev_8_21_14_0_20_47_5]